MGGPTQIGDRTNFLQGLMHMIKGNLGTGILAMPASFSHTGLISALIGLPLLCIIATYCVHLLIRSTILLQEKQQVSKDYVSYANLAYESFHSGPKWMRTSAGAASYIVDAILLVAQFGVCCVYIVFVVDNIISILSTYDIKISKTIIYIGIFPIVLLLSCIKTLRRLAIASASANLLQAVGITCVLEYLVRDLSRMDLSKRDLFEPIDEIALGFGSAMFAFEGISVVLPIYLRMRDKSQMSGILGLINVSYGILLVLYFCVGLFGFLRFGRDTKDAITLNLPPEPFYDMVRAMFTISVLLTYPLQFYVPNEIVWTWARRTIFMVDTTETVTTTVIDIQATQQMNDMKPNLIINDNQASKQVPAAAGAPAASPVTAPDLRDKRTSEMDNSNDNYRAKDKTTTTTNNQMTKSVNGTLSDVAQFGPSSNLKLVSCTSDTIIIDGAKAKPLTDKDLVAQDYCCRIILVSLTFILAICVPKLNLLMDFIGSVTGTSLSLIIPCLIHIGAFWKDTKGFDKFSLISLDLTIMIFGFVAGASGSICSLSKIIISFNR